MNKSFTNTILMVRPASFRMNEETAVNNLYQKNLTNLSAEQIQQNALNEFDAFVSKLRDARIDVIVVEDTPSPCTPDALFPNNWVSFHQTGEVILYPMFAPNRRLERRLDIIDTLKEQFYIKNITDWSSYEQKHIFLEGTGSLILDREHQIAYAAHSERTHPQPLTRFSEHTHYQVVDFQAFQEDRHPIYHTNVMMALGKDLAIICDEAIQPNADRERVLNTLEQTGKDILHITKAQKNAFAGNMLAVKNHQGTMYLIMSSQAYDSMTVSQIQQIEKQHTIIHSKLDTIETCGGGSARCMMAEVFLPRLGR